MELIRLQAKENMWLTQAQEVSDNERIYCHEAVLGASDSEENWRDATQEEYDEWYSRMQALEQEIYQNDDGEEFAVFPE